MKKAMVLVHAKENPRYYDIEWIGNKHLPVIVSTSYFEFGDAVPENMPWPFIEVHRDNMRGTSLYVRRMFPYGYYYRVKRWLAEPVRRLLIFLLSGDYS